MITGRPSRRCGFGANRAIGLEVTGPGIRTAYVSALSRDHMADFTQAIRAKYPRKVVPQGDVGVRLFGASPTIDVDPARTVAGVVREAATGKPLSGVRITFGAATTDRDGRYRYVRGDNDASILVFAQAEYYPERFLTVGRKFNGAQGLGETVADFDIPRGVVINGLVVESGTNRPIVSGHLSGCHIPYPGPLFAGNVFYDPLATNTALRDAPTGLYFRGVPTGSQNYYVTDAIGADGRFRIAVPPGPGVLLVQSAPGLPPAAEMGIFKESEGVHRLFPYAAIAERAPNDGGPGTDRQSFPGFNGPIRIAPFPNYHAYRVINPPADATSLDITLSIPRAPTRRLRFVGRDGHEMRRVKVSGLIVRPSETMTMMLDGSQAEVVGLVPGKSREVFAESGDGKDAARTIVSTDDPPTRTIQLRPFGSISGRVLDASSGLPLAGYFGILTYARVEMSDEDPIPWRLIQRFKTDTDGRFAIRTVVPGLSASLVFGQTDLRWPLLRSSKTHEPESPREPVLRADEERNLGEIRAKPSVAQRNAAGSKSRTQ